ncbi:hypothetical protein [uncultured Draconibacterium sp.]|uniref:hypothetical protein n=1 Tax=uncultured Draconibacterium sp. TaxID=1573823 RepID=UPI003217145E
MGLHNAETSILNELAAWVQYLKFDNHTGNWQAFFKPGKIVVSPDFADIVAELEKHVVLEIIELVAEVLDLNAEAALKYTRNQNIVDLRNVSALVIENRFKNIRQKAISELLGWRNRCSVSTAKNAKKVPEIQQKLNKVYKTYPFLKHGKLEINSPI